ncbi:MAG: zinc-ribbon domain-containing protein [Anaerovoracaceae bacterium]|jgi:hypothetical protein
MICPKCHTKVADTATVCPVCGFDLSSVAKPEGEAGGQPAGNVSGAGAAGENVNASSEAEKMSKDGNTASAGAGAAASGAGRPEAGSQQTGSQQAGSQQPGSQQTGSQQPGSQQAGNQGANAYRASSQGQQPGAGNYRQPNGGPRPTGAPGSQGGRPRGNQGAGYQYNWQKQPGQPGMQGGRPNGQVPPYRPVEPLSPEEAEKVKSDLRVRSIIGFICGILAIAGCGVNIAFAIIGIVFTSIVKNAYKRHGFQPDTDKKLADAGFVCSIVGIVVGVILLIVMIAFAASLGALVSTLISVQSQSYW